MPARRVLNSALQIMMPRRLCRPRPFVVALVAASIVLATGLASAFVSSTWYEDASGYEDALRQQKLFHTPMLVYFRVDWCPHCRAFDALLDDGQVRGKLGSAIKVRINPEHGDAERKIFSERFAAKGYPAIFWVPSENDAPRRISGKGPAETFLAQLSG